MPYVGRLEYGCDISTSDLYKNVQHIPIFHNGDVIEMKSSTFFCTYVKNCVFKSLNYFNFNLNIYDFSLMRLFSGYVRNVMGLKIYHVSEARVINNLGENYETIDYDKINLNLDYEWNF